MTPFIGRIVGRIETMKETVRISSRATDEVINMRMSACQNCVEFTGKTCRVHKCQDKLLEDLILKDRKCPLGNF